MEWGRIRFLKIPLMMVCAIIGVGAWLWFGDGGFVRLYRTESERQACIERIKALAQENQALMDEIHRLRTDMAYVESVARRQLDLIKKNEVIYRFDAPVGEGAVEETRSEPGGMGNGSPSSNAGGPTR
ncbi:MAG: septum formation initiator family protein [Deltaproteobacteria bacterium]|nr:septum formation initiator family protein [Deltaproteobacteria bacterium]